MNSDEMSNSENFHPMLAEKDDDGRIIRWASVGTFTAKDKRFRVRDLKPRFFSLNDVREWMESDDAGTKAWNELRNLSYRDLQAFVEHEKARAAELQHRIRKEKELVEEGALPEEMRVFPDECWAYVDFLRFRANAAWQIIQYIAEKGVAEKGEPVPKWDELTEKEKEATNGTPGRKTVLNDPTTYPAITLQAVLEWTSEPDHKSKPFRGEDSLCAFVADRVKERVGYEVPQETMKSRLQSLMRELDIDLPRGHTNNASYFKARDAIQAAMQHESIQAAMKQHESYLR